MMVKSVFIFLALKLLANTAFADDPVINLPNGPILGRQDESYAGTPYYMFQKIPYAAPPVGNLRFKPPVPPDNWEDVLNTTYLDKICYQITTNLPEESEDCLYINVFTPELPSEENEVSRPVLLYIYGGGFTEGHAMTYRRGPEYLIDYDIVIVTFNYRLGPLGFLSTGDTTVPGNNGIKDQLLAIKWVHDNIQLFGGDPEKVTIVGESAGGVSVSLQLLNTNSEGLFRGAIMESGTAINPWALQRNPREVAFYFASALDSSFSDSNDTEALLEFLLTVSPEDLDTASTQVGGWAPVIEVQHDEAFITQKSYQLLKNGDFVKVPVLMGINSEESLYSAADLNGLAAQAEYYDNNLETLIPEDMRIFLTEEDLESYGGAIKEIYVNNETFAEHIAAAVRHQSDNSFTRAIIRYAEMLTEAELSEVYFYVFSYDGPLGNVTISIEGAEHVAHAEELRYVWRTTRDGYDNSDLSKFPEEDILTQHRMLTMWTNFVKFLNPVPEPTDLLQNVTWWPVKSGNSTDIFYMDIGVDLELKNHPKATYPGWLYLYNTLPSDDFDTF